MWHVQTKVVPVVIGKLDQSQNYLEKLSNIPGKHEIKELQKRAILGTAHVLRKL
jgi:hypothetical protein